MKAVKIRAGLYQVGDRQVEKVIPTFRGKRIPGAVSYIWNDASSGNFLGYTLSEAVRTINGQPR